MHTGQCTPLGIACMIWSGPERRQSRGHLCCCQAAGGCHDPPRVLAGFQRGPALAHCLPGGGCCSWGHSWPHRRSNTHLCCNRPCKRVPGSLNVCCSDSLSREATSRLYRLLKQYRTSYASRPGRPLLLQHEMLCPTKMCRGFQKESNLLNINSMQKHRKACHVPARRPAEDLALASIEDELRSVTRAGVSILKAHTSGVGVPSPGCR